MHAMGDRSPELRLKRRRTIASDTADYESFVVYLPNAASVDVRVDRATLKDLSVRAFVELVRTQNPTAGATYRQGRWSNDVYVEDLEGYAVEDGEFCALPDRTIWLYDDHPGTVLSDFWSVTAVPHVPDNLPSDYTVFSALADQLSYNCGFDSEECRSCVQDNSLQAVYQLEPGKRRLICVDLDHKNGKIVFFDTGKGMDNSTISEWGTLGAVMNEHERSETIGGTPPYLKPAFGMYGFGGIGAGFHLGGCISVSSKTEAKRRVSSSHFTKNILKTTTAGGGIWREAGEVRSPTAQELELSPHGSFTMVEIWNLAREVSEWKVADVQRKLKDYYFPYIQNDDGTGGKTSDAVEFRVNDVDLAGVLGGEVAHSNYYSGTGEPYVLILKLKKNIVTQDDVTPEANARITCRYFPQRQGREAILEILDKLSEENPDYMQVDFEKFSRRSIRRLGRLLPDSQNEKVLPFMEPKGTLKPAYYKRVKAFIDVDGGFTPNQTKMDLLSGDPFSTALLNFGKGDLTSSKPGLVAVSIQRLGCSIEERELQKDYEKWITSQHKEYDTGEGDVLIRSTEQNRKELNISDSVFHVVYSIRCLCSDGHSECIDWSVGEGKQPIRLKLQKGIPNLNNVLYVTVECFILEGSTENSGEARIICRPVGVPEGRGSTNFDSRFELRESRAFPVNIIFSDKCKKLDDDGWHKQVEKMHGRLPGFIEVLNDQETFQLVGHESIPKYSIRAAGAALPPEILAVVRPNRCKPENLRVAAATHLKPRFIIRESMQMKLVVWEIISYQQVDLKYPTPTDLKRYETTISISKNRKLPTGVYSFSTTTLERITTKCGTYYFEFSLVSEKHQNVDAFFFHIIVTPSAKIGSWRICSHPGDCNASHEAIKLRLGRVNPQNLYLSQVDEFGNPMEFEDIPSDIDCNISTVEGNEVAVSPVISRDALKITDNKLKLEIPITVHDGKLAPLRPSLRAVLNMTIADVLVAFCTISVSPGEVSSARIIDASEAPGNQLYPGQFIEELILEVLDECRNPVSSGKKVKVLLDGFAFQDWNGPERFVDENGRLDLGMRLRVISGFGGSARVELQSTENSSLLVMEYTTIKLISLRVRNVPGFISIGSQLTGLVIEAIDETGEVDLTMSGNHHLLILDWDPSIIVPLFEGRGTLPGITMPLQEGNWEGCVAHGHYPNLQIKIRVEVVKNFKIEDDYLDFTAPSANPSHDLPTSPVTEIVSQLDYLTNLCQTTKEETVKLQEKLLRLDRKLTKHKFELERLQDTASLERMRTLKEKINRTEEDISAVQDRMQESIDRFESLPEWELIHGLSLVGLPPDSGLVHPYVE